MSAESPTPVVEPAPVEPAPVVEPTDVAPPAPTTTPAAPVLPPEATEGLDLRDPRLYLNRELTWLNFNFRVLQEAADPRNPLLERLKFIAIVSSNLDEFFMKRIGGLKAQVAAAMHKLTVDGMTAREQLADALALVRKLEGRKRALLTALLAELADAGVRLCTWADLSPDEQAALRQHYTENIFPLVTPQATDPAHPFPFISNLSLNLLVSLRYPDGGRATLARVKVPVGKGIPRLVRAGDGGRFIPLEQVMAGNLDLLFPSMEVTACERFRIIRNANTEKDEEQADDLLAMIESELRERRFAPIVRLEVGQGMAALHRGRLAAELGLDEHDDVIDVAGMLAMGDLMELMRLDRPDLKDPDHHAVDSPLIPAGRNIFHTLRDEGSILVHHPFESFSSSVERFLAEAAADPKVRAIKMTLYRTSEGTAAVDLLRQAALNGKQVAVAVELKARFDEAANIRWATRLEEVGVHVTYGVVGLKTHCKLILVVRQDYSGLKRYAHVGTGNYHAGTARLYGDFGLLTADPAIGRDLTELFNYLTTGYTPRRTYQRLLVAPKHMKKQLVARIEREIRLHTPDHPGLIQFKMNALEDPGVTRALYRASRAGVRVDLIVRDTCRYRPGLTGLSETGRVVSIVGRFLEHTRIYYFRNGGDEEYFIGSADAMKRNLTSRVEVLAPVDAPRAQAELRFLLDAQLDDPRGAWDMRADGSYVQRQGDGPHSQQQCITRYARRARAANKLKHHKVRSPRPNR